MPKLNFLERSLSGVAPQWATDHAVARARLKMFEAEPDWASSSVRGRAATAGDQANSESWKKQRERIEAIWEGRAMEENLCVIAGLLDKISMYTIGNLEYRPQTGDKAADREYADYFHEKCGEIDVTGRHRLKKLAELAVRSMFRDGEFGFVERQEGLDYKLQAIEGDRIGNPNQLSQAEDNIGGIKIDIGTGRVTGYEIHRRTRTNQYRLEGTIGPERFIHLFRPTRCDQYHGVSILKPVIPHAKDLYELFGYEKVAAKFAASFAGLLKSADPFSPDGANTWDTRGTGSKLPMMQAQAGTLQRISKGEEVVFAPGTQRPSGAFIALVQAIFREIALGTNLPYGFIYDMAVFGGVTARLETQQADRVFQRFREMLVDTMLERVKRKVLLAGIAKREIRAVKMWNKGSWNFGASLTGDIGHQVQADSTMVTFGVKTRTRWAAELGETFVDLADEAASEIETLQQISAERNIPLELLNASLTNPTELVANLAKAQAGISDEPEPPPGMIGQIGDKGAKTVIDLLTAVGRGEIDRQSARMTLITVHGMEPRAAEAVLPDPMRSLPAG
jgi:capsid protein